MFISACYYHSRPRMDKSKDKLSYFFPRGREDYFVLELSLSDTLSEETSTTEKLW